LPEGKNLQPGSARLALVTGLQTKGRPEDADCQLISLLREGEHADVVLQEVEGEAIVENVPLASGRSSRTHEGGLPLFHRASSELPGSGSRDLHPGNTPLDGSDEPPIGSVLGRKRHSMVFDRLEFEDAMAFIKQEVGSY
jgi:hypothetical protein